jgi:ubiquitin-like-conjugating enzyme ATG3
MSNLLNDIKSRAIGLADMLTPVLKESKFRETGFLTPEEFVAAGNFLVHHCPTWQWATGDNLKLKDYLPKDKQFLVTKNVPCSKRCKHIMDIKENMEKVIEEESGDGGWVDTHYFAETETKEAQMAHEIDKLTLNGESKVSNSNNNHLTRRINENNNNNEDDNEDGDDNESEGEAIDMESYDHNVIDNDEAVVTIKESLKQETIDDTSHIIQTRTYDLHITYDNYYRTPRLWLNGYDEYHRPLKVDQMYEDISEDHAKKTVTFEAHAHIPGTQMASIHPCRHAEVMKKLINLVAESGKELEVYNYLMVFLKFVQAVIPTIEYDYTRSTQL